MQNVRTFGMVWVGLASLLFATACGPGGGGGTDTGASDAANEASTGDAHSHTEDGGSEGGSMSGGDAGTEAGSMSGGDGGAEAGMGGGDGGSEGGTAALSCDAYCGRIMGACTGDNAQYSSMDACLGACRAFPMGAMSDTSGNTLGCRFYHAGAAMASMPQVHCTHAGPGGDTACGMNCAGFCTIAQSACTGANMQFASMDACMTACSMFATSTRYNTMATTGNSFACRLYHLTVASSSASNAATHCPHIVANSPPCM